MPRRQSHVCGEHWRRRAVGATGAACCTRSARGGAGLRRRHPRQSEGYARRAQKPSGCSSELRTHETRLASKLRPRGQDWQASSDQGINNRSHARRSENQKNSRWIFSGTCFSQQHSRWNRSGTKFPGNIPGGMVRGRTCPSNIPDGIVRGRSCPSNIPGGIFRGSPFPRTIPLGILLVSTFSLVGRDDGFHIAMHAAN